MAIRVLLLVGLGVILLVAAFTGTSLITHAVDPNDPSSLGMWKEAPPLDIAATHLILLRNNKLLAIQEPDMQLPGGATETLFQLYDPNDPNTCGPAVKLEGNETIFCAGHCQLPDGKILLAGGLTSNGPTSRALIFDPGIQPIDPNTSFTDVTDPNGAARYYPTCSTLGDGRVLVTGGFWTYLPVFGNNYDCEANIPTVFDPSTSSWSSLEDAEYSAPDGYSAVCPDDPSLPDFHLPQYPFLFLMTDSNLVFAGSGNAVYKDPNDNDDRFPPPASHYLDQTTETWSTILGDQILGGSAVLFRKDKVLKTGGIDPNSNLEDMDPNDITEKAFAVNYAVKPPTWTAAPDMIHPRQDHYLIALPDGKILAVGGKTTRDDSSSINIPECLDPKPNSPSFGWSELAEMPVGRVYHSSAQLLPDARVVVAGHTGAKEEGKGKETVHFFFPPYLCTTDPRPVITKVNGKLKNEQHVLPYGVAFTIEIAAKNPPVIIDTVPLIRLGAATHGFDQDHRYRKLAFTTTSSGCLNVLPPPNGNEAPPGYYMLFVVSDKGVPSVAFIVKLE